MYFWWELDDKKERVKTSYNNTLTTFGATLRLRPEKGVVVGPGK